MKANEAKRAPALVLGIALLVSPAVVRGADAGETRCWIDKGALVAPAAFGDIAGDFLVDMAAPASALQVTRAQEDGLEGGSATRELVVAGRRLAGATLSIVDLDARTARFDTTINGVVGADLLRRFIVEIDPAPCRLRLLRRRPAPWPGSIRLAIREAGGRPLAPAQVTDGARVRVGQFAIGTADWATLVGGARLSRPQNAGAAAPVRLRAVEVAGRLFEQVPALVRSPSDAREGDAEDPDAIGMAVWSRWRMRLDIQHGWLELAPAASPPASEPDEAP